MRLSIIIPVYNVEKYIVECLKSIYNSKLSEFEVICIDDKGTDNSIEKIKKFVKENKIENLNIITHEVNKGLSEARNTGINNAKGNYVCFLDSDDYLYKDGLSILLEKAEKEDLDIIEGKVREKFETECNIELGINYQKIKSSNIYNGNQYFNYICKKNIYFPMAYCRIFKTSLLKDKCLFTPNIKFEDEDFSPRAIINANKVKYENIEFYVYRRRNNSITTNMFENSKWYESYLTIIKNLTELSSKIKNKKTINYLKKRSEQISLSILKNPISYGANEKQIMEIINVIERTHIYKIPLKSKNIIIKIQGVLMKYPKIFIKIYSTIRRNK